MNVGAVIVAAGYGSFRRGEDGSAVSKVLEDVGGIPMIVRVARSAAHADFGAPIVVANPCSRTQIASVLAAHGFTSRFAVQDGRYGSAHAVECVLPLLAADGAKHLFVIYADMPLWRPDTIRELAELHARECATLSMVTVSLKRDHPREIERYGRILRDGAGRIARVVEKHDATEEELAVSDAVNPSLWIWERDWFIAHVGSVPAVEKGDGHEPERYPTPLIARAYAEGLRIAELPLRDPTEALGVNTFAELERVRAVAAIRRVMGAR